MCYVYNNDTIRERGGECGQQNNHFLSPPNNGPIALYMYMPFM